MSNNSVSVNSLKVFKNTVKLSGANIFALAFGVLTGLVQARILGPINFGFLGILALITRYSGFIIDPGIRSAAFREIPFHYGKGENEKADKIKNVFISSEIIMISLFSSGVLLASFFVSDPLFKFGMITTGIFLFVLRIQDFYEAVCSVTQNFGVISRVTILTSILQSTIILATIYWFGIYSVLLAPIFLTLLIIFYYRSKIRLNFRFDLDIKELKRLLMIGFPLFLGTLAYWGFRLSGRTITASFLGPKELGYFTIASVFFTYVGIAIKDFSSAVQPNFQEQLGRIDNVRQLKNYVEKPTLIIAFLTSFIIGVLFISAHIIFVYLLPKYSNSLVPMQILLFSIFFNSIFIMQNILLNSPKVNKQAQVAFIYLLGLLVNVGLCALFIFLHWGIIGVSIADLLTYIVLTFMVFGMAHKYHHDDLLGSIKYYFDIFAPLVYTLIILLIISRFNWYQSPSILITGLQVIIFGLLFSPCFIYLQNKTGLFSHVVQSIPSKWRNNIVFVNPIFNLLGEEDAD